MSKFLSDEGWFMRAVFGVAILMAGFNVLFLLAYTVLGILGQGWNTDAMYTSLLIVVLVTNWGRARYWRRRALAAEKAERARLIDIALGDHEDLDQVHDAMRKLNWGPLPTVDDLEDRFTTLVLDDGSTLKLHKDLWDEKR